MLILTSVVQLMILLLPASQQNATQNEDDRAWNFLTFHSKLDQVYHRLP